MATITTDTFLDGGVARTAGETWTMNGARLTIRTDTRWHANAPASMTGSLGNMTISTTLGGGITIDGRNVRWLPYNTGAGNVPAIGTTITQGGISGYLLGVWASLTAAPTAVGAAMPASGFIKFREVTGGTFAAGALTGIGASATGPDVIGWIEVMMDQSAAVTVPRLGDFTIRGKWYELGTTNGAANQSVQVPINGGTNGHGLGVWIDDAPVTITGVTWSGGVATYTASGHGFTNPNRGDQRRSAFIQGITPSGYNFADGTIITVVDENTFTVAIESDPGAYSSGGTVNTHVFYPAVIAAEMTTTNFGTDIRSKVVLMNTNGTMVIGHNGTTNVGYVPPSGRKVRIPNVILRGCTTAARATNAAPSTTLSTNPDFTTTSAGQIDIDGAFSNWYLEFLQPYSVIMKNTASLMRFGIGECATEFDVFNVGLGRTVVSTNATLVVTSCFAGGKLTDCVLPGFSTSNNYVNVQIATCEDIVITRGEYGLHANGRAGTTTALQFATGAKNSTAYDFTVIGSRIQVSTQCSNIEFYGVNFCDRYQGTTNATSALQVLDVATSSDILLDGVSWGYGGTIANVHPYAAIANLTTSSNIRIRNGGTRAAILNGGSANSIGVAISSGGNNNGIKVQRVYVQPTRTELVTFVNTDVDTVVENSFGDFADVQELVALNSTMKGCGFTETTTGQVSVYGSHFWDGFTSNTVGRVVLSMNEPTAETDPFVDLVAGTPKFTSAGGLVLGAVGDEVQWTQDYYMIGHTALSAVVPVVTGTNVTFSSGSRWGNHDLYYQIDKGAGFNGTWKNLNATELSAETGIDPATGFRLKIRAVCAIANTGNLLSYIRINTTSTLAAQSDYLYPLDPTSASLTLTGLQANSEVRIYRASDMVEITGIENSGTTFTYNYDHVGIDTPIVIVIHALSYINIRLEGLSLTSSGLTVPIQQQIDRQFANA